MPTFFALIAQSVEHAAVNRSVTGSSPVWGAKNPVHESGRDFTFYFLPLHSYLKIKFERDFWEVISTK